MKFFETRFTRHHLLHAPHQWFLAFLLSPIHFLELHYKKRYHLRFAHARKLFIFDLLLLASVIMIAGVGITWYFYNPTVTDLIYISITPSTHTEPNNDARRIKSGEHVTYTINYRNASSVELIKPILKLIIPKGFILEKATPINLFSSSTTSFTLQNLRPNETKEAVITGLFYGIPDKEDQLIVELDYQQLERETRERKRSTLFITLRDSVLDAKLEGPKILLNNRSDDFTLTLKNTYHHTLPPLIVPFNNTPAYNVDNLTSTIGTLEGTNWQVPGLAPNESAKIKLRVTPHVTDTTETALISFTPEARVNRASFPQTPAVREIKIAKPKLDIIASWQNNREKIRPDEIAILILEIKNKGSIPLENVMMNIPLPDSIIDRSKFTALNPGHYKNGTFVITSQERSDLAKLNPEESSLISLQIPIRHTPQGGTDLALIMHPQINGRVPEISTSIIEAETTTPPLKIGTQLLLNAEARYYTAGGDQLGRGPLPPQVGKETKYSVIITIHNTTNRVENIRFSGSLDQKIKWTGKTSVSRGNDLVYNSNLRTVNWSANSITPYETVSLFFEVSFTPTETDRGLILPILHEIVVNGQDGYINEPITARSNPVTTALTTDNVAQQKGVMVK